MSSPISVAASAAVSATFDTTGQQTATGIEGESTSNVGVPPSAVLRTRIERELARVTEEQELLKMMLALV